MVVTKNLCLSWELNPKTKFSQPTVNYFIDKYPTSYANNNDDDGDGT